MWDGDFKLVDLANVKRILRIREAMEHNIYRTFRDTARDIAKIIFKPKKLSLCVTDGHNIISDNQGVIDELLNYTMVKFKPIVNTEYDAAFGRVLQKGILNDSILTTSENNAIDPLTISPSDIKNFIQTRKTRKSPGPDGITYETLKNIVNIEEHIKELIHKLSSPKCDTSLDIFNAYFTYIPKGASPCAVSDTRPIALQNVVLKVANGLVATKLNKIATKISGDAQFGFVPKRVSMLLPYIAQHYYDQGHIVWLLDLKGAFDTVNMTKVIRIMKAMDFHENITNYVSNTTGAYRVFIGANGYVSKKSITIERGIKQGDPMSPILFNMLVGPGSKQMC